MATQSQTSIPKFRVNHNQSLTGSRTWKSKEILRKSNPSSPAELINDTLKGWTGKQSSHYATHDRAVDGDNCETVSLGSYADIKQGVRKQSEIRHKIVNLKSLNQSSARNLFVRVKSRQPRLDQPSKSQIPLVAVLPLNGTSHEGFRKETTPEQRRTPQIKYHAYIENQYQTKRGAKSRQTLMQKMPYIPHRDSSLANMERIAFKKSQLATIYRSPSRGAMKSQIELKSNMQRPHQANQNRARFLHRIATNPDQQQLQSAMVQSQESFIDPNLRQSLERQVIHPKDVEAKEIQGDQRELMSLMPKIIAQGVTLSEFERQKLQQYEETLNLNKKVMGRKREVAITQGQHAFAKLRLNVPTRDIKQLINQQESLIQRQKQRTPIRQSRAFNKNI